MRKISLLCGSLLASCSVLAQSYSIVGQRAVTLRIDKPGLMASVSQPKTVRLLKLRLSPSARHRLRERVQAVKMMDLRATDDDLPAQVNLGMNGVPVLDQGAHGTCATFAVTASIDALLYQSDYVSQLCSLELGAGIHKSKHGYPSGWDGSDGPTVMKQFIKYGVVSKQQQLHGDCSGVKKYPLNSERKTGKPMSPADYTAISEPMQKSLSLDMITRAYDDPMPEKEARAVLLKVKKALTQGQRVLFGTLLDGNVDDYNAGALGHYHKNHDTWMLTDQISDDVKNNNIEDGHEMVIIGYDDNAVVNGPQGLTQQGVFILRNSWSQYAGDEGNYYVTYAHFIALGLDVQAVKGLGDA